MRGLASVWVEELNLGMADPLAYASERDRLAGMPDGYLVANLIGTETVIANAKCYTAEAVSYARHWHAVLMAEAASRGITFDTSIRSVAG
jgi:hypothetical protein